LQQPSQALRLAKLASPECAYTTVPRTDPSKRDTIRTAGNLWRLAHCRTAPPSL